MESASPTAAASDEGPVSRASRPREIRVLRVPLYGTVRADDAMRRRVDRWFQWPMTVLSLVFVGLLGLEWLASDHPTVETVLDFAVPICWTAFLVELLVKLSIADSRWQYLKKNWLDAVIVLVPLLRPLRVASSVAKMTRVVRLRGAAVKTGRAVLPMVVGLRATHKVMRRLGVQPRVRKRPDEMTRHELEQEVMRLRQDLDALIGPPSLPEGGAPAAGGVAPTPGETVVLATDAPQGEAVRNQAP